MAELQNRTTAMAGAFAAAGYKTPAEKLADMMREAVKAGGREIAALAMFERALRDADDAALVMELVGNEAMRAAALRLFQETLGKEFRDRYSRPDQNKSVANEVDHGIVVGPANPTPRAEARNGPSPRSGQRLPASAAVPYRPSGALRRQANALLSATLIDGKPLGECSAGTARSWARKTGVQARFVLRVCNGLQDEMRIGDYVTEDQAAAEFAKAEAEANA